MVVSLIAAASLFVAAALSASSAFATTVIVVPPTGMANPANFPNAMTNARDYYLANTACNADATCDEFQIAYPASFWPLVFLPDWCTTDCQKWDVSVDDGTTQVVGLVNAALEASDDPIVLFGHSQGSAVISNAMRALANLSPADKARLQIVLAGNIDNPAGGLWSRLGFLGRVPVVDVTTGLPTPTDTGFTFTSIIMQYDGVGNAPKYWGNALAVANAVAGFLFLHGTTLAPDEKSSVVPDYYPSVQDYLDAVYDPANAKTDGHGNTYVVVPTPVLPIVMPLLALGRLTHTTALVQPFVDLVSPMLRVLIDLGYDATEDPGVYSTLSLLPFSLRTDPLKVLGDLARALAQGVHDAFTAGPTPPVAPVSVVAKVAPESAADLHHDSAPVKGVAETIAGDDEEVSTPEPASSLPEPESSATAAVTADGDVDSTEPSAPTEHDAPPAEDDPVETESRTKTDEPEHAGNASSPVEKTQDAPQTGDRDTTKPAADKPGRPAAADRPDAARDAPDEAA